MFSLRNVYGRNLGGENIDSGTAQAASRAESMASSSERQIKNLRSDLARTLMICEALWELLSESEGLSEQDLHKKLYEIDMRDGVLDGKNQRKATKCPECSHMVSPRHQACLYCGNIMDASVFSL